MTYEDPGWKQPLLALALPFVGSWLAGRAQRSSGPLLAIRVLWAQLLQAIWLLVLVGWYLVEPDASFDLGCLVALAALATTVLAFVAAFIRRPLEGDEAGQVLAAYRSRFFIGFALSEVPTLVALGMVVIAAQPVSLLIVGAVASTIGMLLVAPTRRDVRNCEDRLTAAGRSVRLWEALVAPPAEGAT